MRDDPPKERSSEPAAIRLAQDVAVRLGISMTFESGSNVSIYVGTQGAIMKEQTVAQTTTSFTHINDSTVGAVGTARDVNVFITRVESLELDVDLKRSLSKARQELDALNMNERLKADVVEYLDKVVDELQQTKPDQSRLRHLLSAIKEVAAPVASVLSVAASLTKLLGS